MRSEPQKNAFTVVCRGHAEVETAIARLHSHGFDMKAVSVIGRDIPPEREVVACYRIDGSFRYRGALGAFWEGVWERLDGSGVFWMPDFGWILIAGPFAAWVVASLDNSSLFSGLSAFGSAIYSIGIPLEDIPRYETDLECGALLLVIHGSATIVQNARRVFDRFKRAG
jgi:hypothetical protein